MVELAEKYGELRPSRRRVFHDSDRKANSAAIVVMLLMQSGLNVFLAILLTLLSCGGIIGFLDGFWIAYYRIPPFIITLGMMTIARGLALTLSNGSSK
jgi:D-xylose transport system permease protein